MAQTIYASFADASLAEKAAGALLDYGVRNEDISLISRERGTDESAGDTTDTTDTTRRDYTAHSATLAEREGPTTYGDRNDAVNAGDSAWKGTESAGNKIGEGMDRAGARVAGAFGAAGTEANLDRAADEHRMESREDASESRANFRAATDMDENRGARVYGTTDTDYANRDSNTTVIDHTTGQGDRTELAAKQGFSTTTPGDAAAGAAKGAGIGLGVGILAALASLAVPGFGLVAGGGALATAIAGAAGATAAGAVAGGVHGYLKDQGVPDHVAMDYDHAVKTGGAVLAVSVPSGDVDEATCREILAKYSASNVNTYGAMAA
jgi:hypothetical protein